ncbi:cysteine hydrolase family protein [uncultured Sulfitobacter sp.]|uniref:cysteine hydrolase family protein n=1 Tax=uncultured Sulfitobacter sp. TaxID=191468 RepID=UPI0026250025|nr:cysteine hydrolase family protein [uncultured Sulfitobacter sp.]
MTNALILVDIQNDYFTGGLWPVEDMDKVATAAAKVLADARAAGSHIIHIRHEALSATAPFFRPATEGAEIHQSVAPKTDEQVILKHRPNSFHETELHAHLTAHDVTHLTVIGAMSQMCIDATVRAARDLGYDVTVVAEACGAKSASFGGQKLTAAQVQAAFMSGLAQAYATVI